MRLSNLIASQGGGVRFRQAMGSAILAACNPTRFTIADSRALNALRKLRLVPAGPPTFRMQDWDGYLTGMPGVGQAWVPHESSRRRSGPLGACAERRSD